tara:strand:- start:1221 stop:1481 length:261 start_codon:yes stop_codon:yes gene_type:complete
MLSFIIKISSILKIQYFKMFRFIFISSLVFFCIFSVNAYAYLDPGTGSIILQAIIGFIAAVGATVGLYWQKFKVFFKRLFNKDKKN